MSLQKSLGWMALGQALSVVSQFAASVILARLLTPQEFGVFAVALAVAGVLSLLQALGLQALIVRERNLTEEVTATAFTINAIIAIAVCALIIAASSFGGAFLKEDGVRRVLMAIAFTPLIGILVFLPAAQLERSGQFKEIAIASVLASFLSTITTVYFALRGSSFMSFAYGQWAQALAFAFLIMIYGKNHVSFKLGLNSWRHVSDFGFQMFAVVGVNAISGKLSDLILGRLIGLSALGLYSRASSLNGLVWTNIHMVLGRVLLVDFADIVKRGESLRPRYLRSVSIITALLWPAFLGLAIISRPFVNVIFGEDWLGAALPLALLAVASAVQVAMTMTWELFASTGNLRIQTRLEFIRAILAVVAFTIGCLISLEAAAAARIVDALVANFMYRSHVNSMTNTRNADYVPIYLQSLGLAAIAVMPSLILMASTGFAATTPFGAVIASVVCGVLLWVAGLRWMRHPLFEEGMRVAKTWRAGQKS